MLSLNNRSIGKKKKGVLCPCYFDPQAYGPAAEHQRCVPANRRERKEVDAPWRDKKEGEVGQRSYCTKCVPGMYPRYSNWPTRFFLGRILGLRGSESTGRISKQAKAEIKKKVLMAQSFFLMDQKKG